MTENRDSVWRAGRLLQWGLRPLMRPAQEAEYRELVDAYFDDSGFRDTVRSLADGLGLLVLDVSEHGMVLAPQDNSVFQLRPSEFRSTSSKAEDRLLDGLAQIAIAATVFPRARDLDEDPDITRSPITIDEVEAELRQLCERLADEARKQPDPPAANENAGLFEAWRIYLQRLESIETRDSRKAMRATRRIIEYSFERLREYGCFTQVRVGEESAWQPTRRYQILVQQLSSTALFQLVRTAIEPRPEGQG